MKLSVTILTLRFYSDWPSPGPGQELRSRHEPIGCMVLCRTFHTALEQGQGPTPIVHYCSGCGPCTCPGTGHGQCDYTINYWSTTKERLRILYGNGFLHDKNHIRYKYQHYPQDRLRTWNVH